MNEMIDGFNLFTYLRQICLQFNLSIQYVQNMQYITLCKCYVGIMVFVYKDIMVFVYKDQPISFLAMTSNSRSDIITLPFIFLYRFQTFAKTNQGNPLIII